MSLDTPAPLEIRVRHVGGAPVIAVRAWLRGGARTETTPGQSLITGRLLAEGSQQRDWRRIAHEAESRGMLVESFGGYESIGVAIDALATDTDRALAWLIELVTTPTFPEERFTWIRRQAAAELESLLDPPDARTGWAFLEQLYQKHPYGRPLHGTTQDLERLNVVDCSTFHALARRHGLVVIVTGAVDEDAVRQQLEDGLAADAPTVTQMATAEPPARPSGLRHHVTLQRGDQAHLFAGHLTIPRRHKDRSALEILAVALGAGPGISGRLAQRLREQDGLAYDVAVACMAGAASDAGRLNVHLGTAPENLSRAEAAIREELTRLLESGLDDREIAEARSYLIGSTPFRCETARQWIDRLADAVFYHQPVDPEDQVERWRTLDHTAVTAAARRHIHLDRLHVTTSAPAAAT